MTPGQRTLIDYGGAVAAVLLAWLVRQLMQPLLGAQVPNATFLIAVIFIAWRCGLWPALLAMILGYAIGFFFFIPPYYEFAKPAQQMLVITGVFYFLISISIAVVSEVLRRAHRRADGSAKDADARRQELEREITERKGIEAALREQQAWFRVTFHSIADAVLTTNGAGQVAYLNPVAEELTGWSQEDAAGKPLDAVFRLIHEHTRQPLENPVTVALREDRAVGISNHSVLVGKSGRETPIDDSAAPIKDDDDKIIGGVLVFRDVTQRRQSEAAARHAASIVDFSDDAIFSKSNSGIILSWNKGAENLYGYSADEIVGKSVELLFPPTEQQELGKIFELLRQGERIEHFETVRRRKDGTLVDVSVNISPLRDAEGHVIGASTIARGIARQKAVEAEIRRLNRDLQQWISEFQTLLDVIPISIAVTDDADCRRIWTNPTMARLLHLPQDANASLSAPPSERPTTYRVFQNGRELPTERLPLHVATSTGREVREMEIDLVLDDGAVVNMLSFAAPLFDESGQVRGGIFAGIDLTDRKEAEQALRRSEQELSDFFENATVGLHWSGPDGVILRANRAELEMLGYDRHEYIGHHVAEFHVDEEAAAKVMTRLQNGERLHDVPAQLKRKDGSILDVLIDSSVMWEDGRFVHTRTFMRDITQRKRAEQRRNLELAVTQILAETVDTADSIPQIMQVICQELGWEVGAFWQPDEDAGLTCLHVGCPEDASFGEFAAATRGRTFSKGQGLPGRVWSTGEPSWIAEVKLDDNFPRAPAALASGLRSGLGVPVLAGREFLGVLEFFSCRSQSPDFELLDLLGSIAGKIGQCLERQTSQQELEESAERLRLALTAGKMGTWEWTVATGKVLWSPNLEAIHGKEPGTFPGTFEAYQQDIHPYDRDFVVRSLTQTLEKGEDHRIEYRIIWPDGSIHWVEARGKVFRDTAGKPIRLVGVCIDIDERERLETELRRRVSELAEAEGRVRSVVDNVIDGIITINESGTVETVNPAAEQIFGYVAREMVGQNVRLLMPEPFHGEHDGYLANYFRTGQPKVIGIGREVIGQRKDGSTFPMDLAVGEFQLRDRKFFTGVVRDITERKHNEQTLRFLANASAALAGLLDYESTLQRVAQLAVPFFADWCSVDMLEPEGNVRRVASAGNDPNKVRLADEIYRRFPPDPKLPHGVGHILRTSQPELVPEITDEQLAMSVNGDQEMLGLLRRLGLKSYMGLPLRIRGQTLGVITFVTAESGRIYRQADLELAEDLARRAAIAIDNAQLYAEIRQADKRKDEFLATLAHELRNPLTPIRNALQLMQMSAGSQPVFEGVRSTMERQIDQMVRLIDDLLDVSRITRNKLELRLEQVDLAEVIASAMETCRPLIDEAKHDLQLSLPGSPILLHADFTRLAQVFANLLNNACKYTEPGGKIAIVAKRTGDQVEVRVQDTGIGISPESLPNIFDMFTQVDASLERSQGGLGIGLTLVRRLVEMHGGSVSARSEGKGRGTEFIVRLPASVSAKPAARHDGSPQLPAAVLPKRKILVVDDNRDAADTMSMILKMLGNEVQTVYDGLAALEAVDTFQPSMLLLDIGLPKMNGYDAARNIRAKHGQSIVLAALTGWGQEEDRRRSKEAGFDHHLVKPASAAMLRNLLANLPVP